MCRQQPRRIHEEYLNVEELKNLPYLEARKQLVEFSGVGLKVADCVLLFSLEKMEAFPVDIWVKRIILNHYASLLPEPLVNRLLTKDSLSDGDYRCLNAFGRTYFGQYAGYAQEYLYHFERTQR